MSIEEALEKISKAVYGSEVRQALIDAINSCYKDATTNGNANMEVGKARGLFSSLVERLNDSDFKISNLNNTKANDMDLQAVKSSIANIIAHNNSTDGNTELLDIRTVNGKTYSSAGEATRSISEELHSVSKKTKNLIDTTKSDIGKFIMYADGRLSDSDLYDTTDFIPVKNGQNVVISPKIRKLLLYDSNKQAIVNSLIDDTIENYVYSATRDGYIRITYFHKDANKVQAEYGNIVTSYEPYGENNLINIHSINGKALNYSKLNEKIGISIGDSIMHGEGNDEIGILDLLEKKYNCISNDFSVSGATIQDLNGYYHITDQVDNILTKNINPNFILIDGASNDISSGRGTIGTISDDFNYSKETCDTFVGGLEYCIGKFRTAFPNALIIYVIPHSTPNRNFAKEKEYYNTAIKVCEKWSVPVANIFNNSGLNARITEQANIYTTLIETQSATHPNQLGYIKFYLPLIYEILNRYETL